MPALPANIAGLVIMVVSCLLGLLLIIAFNYHMYVEAEKHKIKRRIVGQRILDLETRYKDPSLNQEEKTAVGVSILELNKINNALNASKSLADWYTEGVIDPMRKSTEANDVSEFMFHTSTGRTMVMFFMQLNNQISSVLLLVMSLFINGLVSHEIATLNDAGLISHAWVQAIAVSFVIYFCQNLLLSTIARFIDPRMGSSGMLYMPTDDDVRRGMGVPFNMNGEKLD
jgi:hypothetical protein